VPPFVAAQQAGAELLGAIRRRIDVRYPEVEMRLLRTVLVRPLRRQMVGGPLQADPPAVTGVDRDPLVVVVGDAPPTGELLLERRQEVDVRGVERHGPQRADRPPVQFGGHAPNPADLGVGPPPEIRPWSMLGCLRSHWRIWRMG
jgi:hypothetical protein